MYAITIDQRKSREQVDRVPELLKELAPFKMLRHFERTAGDEVQGLSKEASDVVAIALAVARSQAWWIGIGVGDVDTPLPESTRASRGPALIAARSAVGRAKNSPVGIAIEGVETTYAETALVLAARIVIERTPEGNEAVRAMQTNRTQVEAASQLKISAQAMNSRLKVARWTEEQRATELAIHLLQNADAKYWPSSRPENADL